MRWSRPRWSLPLVWTLLAGPPAWLDWRGTLGWLWLVDVPLALVFAWHALAWQPWKAMRPGLLAVLHLAFAWLPMAFVLYAVQDVIYATRGDCCSARAAARAGDRLFRLDAGGDGDAGDQGPFRPADCRWAGWRGCASRCCRRGAAAHPRRARWRRLHVAGDRRLGLVAGVSPWVLRSVWIYLTPRVDGKPG